MAYARSLLVVVICHTGAVAQLSSTVWLTIRDDAGGQDSLVFGTHQFATYCIDTALGENCFCQGAPPGPFYAVFQSIVGRYNCFSSLGLIKKDLRDFSSTTKKDTFYIDFTNLDSIAQLPNVKTTLRWPDSAYLSKRCDSLFLQDRYGGLIIPLRINMFAQDSLVLWGVYDPSGPNIYAPTMRVEIFRYGTHLPYVDGIANRDRQYPSVFTLHQNYPNPLNPATTISYDLPKAEHVTLKVYDLLGQEIATLVNKEQQPGTYTATWVASTRPSGVYFYRMSAGEFVQTKKAILLR